MSPAHLAQDLGRYQSFCFKKTQMLQRDGYSKINYCIWASLVKVGMSGAICMMVGKPKRVG